MGGRCVSVGFGIWGEGHILIAVFWDLGGGRYFDQGGGIYFDWDMLILRERDVFVWSRCGLACGLDVVWHVV